MGVHAYIYDVKGCVSNDAMHLFFSLTVDALESPSASADACYVHPTISLDVWLSSSIERSRHYRTYYYEGSAVQRIDWPAFTYSPHCCLRFFRHD